MSRYHEAYLAVGKTADVTWFLFTDQSTQCWPKVFEYGWIANFLRRNACYLKDDFKKDVEGTIARFQPV